MDGGSGIIGPDGRYVAGPIYKEEKIIYAEIDPKAILKEKWKIDPVGHYRKNDVIQMVIQKPE